MLQQAEITENDKPPTTREKNNRKHPRQTQPVRTTTREPKRLTHNCNNNTNRRPEQTTTVHPEPTQTQKPKTAFEHMF